MINQYWASKPDGEKYAVQIENGVVIDACGPLYYKEVTQANLDTWNFNGDSELAESINANQENYGLVEAPYVGDQS